MRNAAPSGGDETNKSPQIAATVVSDQLWGCKPAAHRMHHMSRSCILQGKKGVKKVIKFPPCRVESRDQIEKHGTVMDVLSFIVRGRDRRAASTPAAPQVRNCATTAH